METSTSRILHTHHQCFYPGLVLTCIPNNKFSSQCTCYSNCRKCASLSFVLLADLLFRAKNIEPRTQASHCLNSAPCLLLCSFSQEELERLDSEGRVLMTDHGGFVLVNVYGPAISTEESAEERYAFKLRFYEVGPPALLHAPIPLDVLTAALSLSASQPLYGQSNSPPRSGLSYHTAPQAREYLSPHMYALE